MGTSLAILDLVPIPSGSTPQQALRNTVELAQLAESQGYSRYWLAEHHLAAGVLGSTPALVAALVAGATSTLRVGSGAVLMGHQTPLSVVEQFGLLDVAYPGRIDLGLGRSGPPRASGTSASPAGGGAPDAASREERVVDGLLLPKPFAFTLDGQLGDRIRTMMTLLKQTGAEIPDFARQVDDILALIAGSYTSASGAPVRAVPGTGADLQVWVLGSSGGESARVAGERGLPFAANYHVAPASVLDAVTAYRAAFRPSTHLPEPYVVVSADVVVADTFEQAQEIASPYGLWVHSIRADGSAIPFPSPEEAARHEWTESARALVADRVATQFVGTGDQVAERLATLQRVTGADELLVTTMTHRQEDRLRSYELLASAWQDSFVRSSAA